MSARNRAGSRFKRFLCFVLCNVRRLRESQIHDHFSRPITKPLSAFQVLYLTNLSVARVHSVGDKMTSEYKAVGGLRIVRGNRSTPRKSALIPFWA
jgi:hypothetical protein